MSESQNSGPTGTRGWSVLWGLTRGFHARIGLLAASSFAGAMLEAGFLVLVTSTLLAVAGGRTEVGPVLGHAVSVEAALGVAATAVVLRLVLNLGTVHVSAGLSAFVRTEQRRRLANAYLRAAWEVQQSEAAGRLQELLTSFVGRVNIATAALAQGITAALSLLAFLGAGLIIEPVGTVVVLGSLMFLGALLAPLRIRIRSRAADSAGADLAFANAVSELGSLGREMQTLGVRDRFVDHIDGRILTATEGQRRVQVLNGSLSPAYTFFAYSAVLVGVGALSLLDLANLGAIGSVMLLMLRSLSYGQQLSSVLGVVASSLPSLEQLELTVARYEASPAAGGTLVPSTVAPVVAHNVRFAYSGNRPAIEDLNLTIAQGEMLGVIGPSGAGKSTLAQLLLGLRAPQSGSLSVGGVDLREVDRAWLTQTVSFVPQDPLLFTGTVAENIRFFREGLDDEALRRAAVQANVLHDIDRLPQGFDTHLGERGSQLSGGQRQRLSIARALVGCPQMVILDEPTSALDGESEALIRETLAKLQGGVTVVIIAHRMSTLDLCDQILVIEGGRASAQGSPDSLRKQSEFYRRALAVAGMS